MRTCNAKGVREARGASPVACRILFVVNVDWFFLSHRLPIALAAREAGYNVHVAAAPTQAAEEIRGLGFPFHPLPFDRKGTGWRQEFITLRALGSLYRRLRPGLVHHVTIKPVLYGGAVARLAGVPAVVSAVSGLGYVFLASGAKASVLRAGVRSAYRFALGHRNSRAIFQNPDDLTAFVGAGIVRDHRAVLIRGSGVDLTEFVSEEEPLSTPLVVLAARMLWDKGVGEFVEAARRLRAAGVQARFALVGGVDPGNPAHVPQAQLFAWREEGAVEWWGHRPDMASVFARSHVVCLPSYREGLPKVLIEAAASGRPIVATDTPGCREIVRHGENGLLVPVRDAVTLAEALKTVIEDPALRRRLGRRGREIAVAEFSVEKVVAETLTLYRELLP